MHKLFFILALLTANLVYSSELETRIHYQNIANEIRELYLEEATKRGLTLTINFHWESNKVNAYATRDMQDNWIINIHGALLKNRLMSVHALEFIICHEIGHFLGGAPKKIRRNGKPSWSSAEGQADYFASSKCLPRLYEKRTGQCKPSDIIAAGEAATSLFSSLRDGTDIPQVTDFDDYQVTQTLNEYPSNQCRLDTVVAGANCSTQSQIHFNDSDPMIGSCHRTYYNQSVLGARPLCWYRPEL